jgi:3',5'-cyclic-AMP phosphodiesterase
MGRWSISEVFRIGGVGGIVGNTSKPGRRDANTFLGLIERVLAQDPDILVLHEGPDDPASRAKGNPEVRELLTLAREGLLVICGHSPWTHPLAWMESGCQVLNTAERAVLLVR